MSVRFDPRVWAGVAALLAMGTVTLPAQEKKAAAKKEEQRTAPASSGVRAYIDPATGKLRQPTREDLQSEAAAVRQQAQPITQSPKILRHPSGAVSAVLGPEHMSYSVVKKNDDGTLSMSCVEGEKKAETWIKESKKPLNPTLSTLSKEKLDVK